MSGRAIGEGLLPCYKENWNGLMGLAYVSGMDEFPEGEFFLVICPDMVTTATRAVKLSCERLRKVGQDANSYTRISSRSFGLIETVGKRGLEIIFWYFDYNRIRSP